MQGEGEGWCGRKGEGQGQVIDLKGLKAGSLLRVGSQLEKGTGICFRSPDLVGLLCGLGSHTPH